MVSLGPQEDSVVNGRLSKGEMHVDRTGIFQGDCYISHGSISVLFLLSDQRGHDFFWDLVPDHVDATNEEVSNLQIQISE